MRQGRHVSMGQAGETVLYQMKEFDQKVTPSGAITKQILNFLKGVSINLTSFQEGPSLAAACTRTFHIGAEFVRSHHDTSQLSQSFLQLLTTLVDLDVVRDDNVGYVFAY
jgi:adenylosuccinate synthase